MARTPGSEKGELLRKTKGSVRIDLNRKKKFLAFDEIDDRDPSQSRKEGNGRCSKVGRKNDTSCA